MRENEKDTVVSQTKAQANCNLTDPRDFEVIEAGAPFHGQRGDSEAQRRRLLKQGEGAANASNFSKKMEEHPSVDRAKKPHTP
jgi:hypothetical protein